MRFRQCSSCVSRLNFHTHARQAVAIQQSPSRLPGPPNSFAAELSPPASTTQQRIEQRSLELCTPQAHTITTSANQRDATMVNSYDCVSYAVNLIGNCAGMYSVHGRVMVDNVSFFLRRSKSQKIKERKNGKEASKGTSREGSKNFVEKKCNKKSCSNQGKKNQILSTGVKKEEKEKEKTKPSP